MTSKTQKYFLHPLTAIFFATAAALTVYHYQLIDFSYSHYAVFGFVFLSYMFLSKKYDPSMTYIFLLVAAFIFYKGLQIKPLPANTVASEETLKNKLSVLASLIKAYEIEKGDLPETMADFSGELITQNNIKFSYCSRDLCLRLNMPTALTNGFTENSFLVIGEDLSDNEKTKKWYIDKDLDVFVQNKKGVLTLIKKEESL